MVPTDDATPPESGEGDPDFANLNQALKAIHPDLFGPDLNVDWDKVRKELNLDTWGAFLDAFYYLYQTDANVNLIVNRRLLSAVMAKRQGKFFLPLILPTAPESAWLAADNYCDKCPGASYYEYTPGQVARRCMSENRIEKYESCKKYRENISESTPSEQQSRDAYSSVKDEFREKPNV